MTKNIKWYLFSAGLVACLLFISFVKITVNKSGAATPEENNSSHIVTGSTQGIMKINTSDKKLKSKHVVNYSDINLGLNEITLDGNIDLENAKLLLSRIASEVTNLEKRAEFSAIVIMELCKSGYAEEAWTLLPSGYGIVRSMMLSALCSQDDRDLADIQKQLMVVTNVNEYNQCLQGLAMARKEKILDIDFSTVPLQSRDHFARIVAMQFGKKNALLNAQDYKDMLDKISQAVIAGEITPQQYSWILDSDKNNSANYQWNLLQRLIKSNSKIDLEVALGSAAVNLIKNDFSSGMTAILSNDKAKYSSSILNKAVIAMFDMDSQKANEWVYGNINKIDPASAQRVIASVAQVAIRDGDYDNAQRWANQLLNQQVRAQLEKQIEDFRNPVKPQTPASP